MTRSAKFRHSMPSVVALSIAMLLMAGCGSGGTSSSPTSSTTVKPKQTPTSAAQYKTVDACSLVAAADASEAAGASLTQVPTGGGASQVSICVFANQATPSPGSQSSQALVLVLAQVYPDTNAADSVQADQVAAALAGQFGVTGVSNAKAVGGIGDKAIEYTATSSGGGGMGIFVFKSNVVMFIVVSPATDSTKIEKLARTAVGNLAKAAQ